MFISERNKERSRRSLIIYGTATGFIALFGFVYQIFGHGVTSLFMYLAFLFPLVLGCFVYLAFWLIHIRLIPSQFTTCVYNAGVAILTCGFIYKGVTDIYGTSRDQMFWIYMIIGFILIGTAIILYIIGLLHRRFTKDKLVKES